LRKLIVNILVLLNYFSFCIYSKLEESLNIRFSFNYITICNKCKMSKNHGDMKISDNKDVIVRLVNLSMKFSNFYAVSDVNLEIKRGEVVGFLGPNGAGKSTTMKMMANLLRPTAGEVWIRANGEMIKLDDGTKDYLLNHMGFLIENPVFYESMSPRQVLTYFAKLKGYPREQIKERVEEVVKMVGLMQWIDKKIGTFSKGMRQKIGVISAIVHNPEIIILDEPHTGLDPSARKEIRDFILQLKEMGKTIFLSSHLLFEVAEVADRVAIISKGHLAAFDTLENLEEKAKKSIIRFELLQPPAQNEFGAMLQKLDQIITPSIGIEKTGSLSVRYTPETHLFEVLFDGNSNNQAKILRDLINNNIDVVEFSVPKANLLEELYLSLIRESTAYNSPHQQQLKSVVEVQPTL
jgi:ABC-2 type transport system ATP-binding protein